MSSVPGSQGALARTLRSVGGRFGWGVADQALSSLTNFGLGLLAARALVSAEFGAFAVVFAVYVVVIGATRAITSEPFVIRFSTVTADEWRKGAASASGSALIIGVVAGLASLVVGLIVGGVLGGGLMALGVMLPGLLLQDTWRFVFFAARRGAASFLNDLVWAIGLAGGLAMLVMTGATSVGWLVVVWAGAGALAGLFGIVQASVLPHPAGSLGWVRGQRDLVPRFLGEFSVTTGVGQITTFGLGVIAGLVELGALRAGQILLGPLNVLFLGVSIVAVPEGVRLVRSSAADLVRFCRRLSLVLAIGALSLGGAIWLLPDEVGTALLRENWSGGRSVIVPLALGMALFAFVLGAGVGLRSMAAARLSLRARLLVAPPMLAGPLIGAALAGAVGAAWGGTFASVVSMAIWWVFLLKGVREYRPAREAGTPTDEDAPEPMTAEAPYG